MTVASTLNKNVYVGNGTTTAFPITFPYTDESQIQLFITDSNNATTQITSNYTIDTANNQVIYPANTVINPILTSAYNLTIYRKLPLVQELALTNQGAWNPKVIENKFDNFIMMLQQHDEQIQRSVQLPVNQTGGGTDLLNEIYAVKTSIETSESNAKTSENNTKLSENNAKLSETNAQLSAIASANTATQAQNTATAMLTATQNAMNTVVSTANNALSLVSGALSSAIGFGSYISNGRNITPSATNLTCAISLGTDYVNSNVVNIAQNNVTLNPRMASLIYDNLDGTTNKVEAKFPDVDQYTIGRWIIDGSNTIANSAVGVNGNTIAVANNLTKSGTVSQVDGWLGYAGQGDGSTGYYISANSTGFPIGASEREIDVLSIIASITGVQVLIAYGISGTNTGFQIYTNGARITISNATTALDTGFDVEVGETYLFSIQYDGTNILVLINGTLVYKAVEPLNTTISNLYISRNYSADSYSKNIINFIEIRNKMRTPQQIAQMANNLILPCFYDKIKASYPIISSVDLSSAYHEYKFDELTGNAVADSVGTLNGTAFGTTIVDSEIGLNKARKFSSNSDNILCGSISLPNSFTMIFVGNIKDYSSLRTLFSNRNAASTVGNYIYVHTNGFVRYCSASSDVPLSVGAVTVGRPVFIAVVVSGTQATLYQDSPNITNVTNISSPNTTSSPLYLGYDTASGASGTGTFAGIMEYLLIIPRSLSQPEIAQYYNSFINRSRSDIRDILPNNSISLGMARTDSTKLLEVSTYYKYGRREGTINGNRRQFLGWKYFNGGAMLTWENPFGTRKIRCEYRYAEDSTGRNECVLTREAGGTTNQNYGYEDAPTTNYPIRMATLSGGVVYLNGAYKTSGYIGCYAEVLE